MQPKTARTRRERFADLAVLFVLAGLVAIYCIDALRASTDILNLIFVLPVTIVVLLLCLLQFIVSLRAAPAPRPGRGAVGGALSVIGLFAGYVISLPWFGFDVGTTLFIGVFLWLHGERRVAWLLGYAIGFGFALAVIFAALLPYPMPMLMLPTDFP